MYLLRALKLGLWLVRRAPHQLLRLLHHPLGAFFFLARVNERRIIIANQRQVLGGASWLRLHWQAYRVMVNVARNYHTLLRLFDLGNAEIRGLVDLRGEEHLNAALARGQGAIVLGAHMANYNVLAPVAALFGPPAGAFVEPVQPPDLFTFVSQSRARTGLHLLPASREGAQAAIRLLRRNGILLVAGDRYLGANGTIVDFFGRATLLPHGMVILALRNDTPILPATLRGLPRGRLSVQLRPPLPLVNTGRTREDLAANMRLVARALEETIGGAPEQWIVLDPVWPALPLAQALDTPPGAPARLPGHRAPGTTDLQGRVARAVWRRRADRAR